MKKDLINQRETRVFSHPIELRAEDGDDKKKKVFGYAAKFNSESQNMGDESWQFYEVLEKGAFDDVLNDDIRALFNHEPDHILARSREGKGSLRVGVDEVGLFYEFEPPDTQLGRDLMVSIERGDIDQSSFGFSVSKDGQRWEEKSEGGITIAKRFITKVSRLFDVSPVTFPAYLSASVSVRNMQELAKELSETSPDPAPNPEPAENHFIAHRQRALDLIDKSAAK
jgi:HK97 family phage prohead protease